LGAIDDALQTERDEEKKYIEQQVKYMADILQIKERTDGKYELLEMTIRHTYKDAWMRGSDYRMEQDTKIIRDHWHSKNRDN
jgi:hypothetical protein